MRVKKIELLSQILRSVPKKSKQFTTSRWVFPNIGVPQNGWFKMENPTKNGWFGGISPTIFGNIQIVSPGNTHISFYIKVLLSRCFVPDFPFRWDMGPRTVPFRVGTLLRPNFGLISYVSVKHTWSWWRSESQKTQWLVWNSFCTVEI